MPQPLISVLVVTHDRPALLRRVLDDLALQDVSHKLFEVLVSDDGSQPPVEQTLKRWQAQSNAKFSLQWVHGPQRGPATARNRAIERLNAPLTLFLNDDVSLNPDLIRQHLRLQGKHPAIWMGTFQFPEELREDMFHRVAEDLGLIGTLCMTPGTPLPATMCWTGNLCLPTHALKTVGGFDTNFREPKGEDIDLGFRLLRDTNLQLFYSEYPVALHHHTFTPKSWWDRARMIGRAQRALADKHQDPLFWPGGIDTLRDARVARSIAARTAAQSDLAQGFKTWVERLVEGGPIEGPVEIPELQQVFQFPQQTEPVLRAAILGATTFLFQDAFWAQA